MRKNDSSTDRFLANEMMNEAPKAKRPIKKKVIMRKKKKKAKRKDTTENDESTQSTPSAKCKNPTCHGKIIVVAMVITKMFLWAVAHPGMECAGLLIGTVKDGVLVISDVFLCKRARGTHVSIEIDPIDFIDALKTLKKEEGIYGWAHSHPGFGPFMSGTDVTTQRDFQNLFPMAVALVLDPFHYGAIEFKFFRIRTSDPEQVEEIQYEWRQEQNDTQKADLDWRLGPKVGFK
ncbi:MAG: Mov34/MPN/PAD-1 family protein [Candidatus Nanoarchaeia archaeon]|nr:Mov34/MPN/PAD-1 family protein [Candidatus Nanoarchaeia archaeon]